MGSRKEAGKKGGGVQVQLYSGPSLALSPHTAVPYEWTWLCCLHTRMDCPHSFEKRNSFFLNRCCLHTNSDLGRSCLAFDKHSRCICDQRQRVSFCPPGISFISLDLLGLWFTVVVSGSWECALSSCPDSQTTGCFP